MRTPPASSDTFLSAKSPILLVFALSLIYWTYLFFATSMEIKHDAQGYQTLGAALYQGGIPAFFKTSGSNVIFYPLIIAVSMHIGDFLGINHLAVQKLIQLSLFSATQVLLYHILQKLNIRKSIAALTLLYFGLSPALVNSALCSWSEISSYPFVLGILVLSTYTWQMTPKNDNRKLWFSAAGLLLFFLIVTMTREVYEYVFALFTVAYLFLSLGLLARKRWKFFGKAVILLAAVFSLYQISLLPYKMTNLKYNGYKGLVLKGGMSLAGGAVMRSQKLTSREILSFLASVPGDNVIKKFFGEDEYNHWYFDQFRYGYDMAQELRTQGVSPAEIDWNLYQISAQHILKNPFQYCFLTAAQGMKMLFWESTKIGFVNYPAWLAAIFDFVPFKNLLRIVMFLLTFSAVCFALGQLWTHRHTIYDDYDHKGTTLSTIYFAIVLIVSNIALHAPFIIETRYALPIAPLYLILIALMFERLVPRR